MLPVIYCPGADQHLSVDNSWAVKFPGSNDILILDSGLQKLLPELRHRVYK
jgi:hypothetical protein